VAVHFERIPSTDPRLGRHVRHDDRSRAFAYPTAGLTLTSAKHTRRIPVLDQGQLGSCTGNAGIGALGTDPYFETLVDPGAVRGTPGSRYSFDEAGAVALYSAATKLDDAPGSYPPDDTGSDGLSVAKALKTAGEISGYQHTFTLTDALLALGKTPVITGVSWHEDMFQPDSDGRVHITGALAGGHEFVVDEIDVETERVWFTNSWGTSWGVNGRAYLTFDDWGRLLADQGDVTVFTPLTQPAPTPTPAPPADPDQALAAIAHPWVLEHHTAVGGNNHMASALKAWLHAKGL
jgi:hypothetical protein